MTYYTKDILKIGKEELIKNNIDAREARLLLAFALNIESSDLVKYESCTESDYFKFLDLIKRRSEGEPYAYIVGYKEFMKLKFLVNKYVLIPRDDTETLVLEAIKQGRKNILDLCTGSGCVGISLAKYINNSNVDASDICARALSVAKKNAKLNNANVNFIKSNLFENINKKYEMIVSNPPYIKTEDIEHLQKEVKNEPQKALDGGASGLDFYDKILKKAKDYLTSDGVILFEIGFDQAQDVMDLMKKYNYKKIKKIKDLSNNDRVVLAERR